MNSSSMPGLPTEPSPYLGVPRVMWSSDNVPTYASLLGIIAQTCADNHHESTSSTLDAAGANHHQAFDIAVSAVVDPERLAHVLRLPVADVRPRFHARIERAKGPPLYCFFGASVPRYDLQFRRRCVSPSALAESAYHRAIWCHSLVPFCTDTGEWLIDECPQCHRRLGWYHTNGVARCDDRKCGFDLRTVCCARVDDERFRIAGPIARLLDPDPSVHEPAMKALPRPFHDLDRGAAFELVWRLGRLRVVGSRPRDVHCKLDREEIVDTMCAGASFLGEWPASLDEMIRDAANENADRTLSLLRTLRGFRVDATWPEHRHVLEEALPYLKKRDRAILLELRDDMTDGEEAARLLGVSFGSLADMNRKGLLPAQGMTGEQRLHAVFSRATLCELRSPLRDRAVLGRGAERVGVSVHGIEQLICSGAITTVSDPLVQRLYQAVQISKVNRAGFAGGRWM